jgi:hypothetical protein
MKNNYAVANGIKMKSNIKLEVLNLLLVEIAMKVYPTGE